MSTELLMALSAVYGEDPSELRVQLTRYEQGLAAFAARYGPGPVTVFRAPGRVNLIGEHTDYNHGFVLPMALDKDVLVFARARDDRTVRLANVEAAFPDREFAISADIPAQPTGDWANYAQGPAQLFERELGPGLRGYDALVDGEPPYGVPRGAGVSSSSALTVASAVTLLGVNGLELSGPALADACGRAEWYVGTRGGIMDQFISVLARRDHALFLDCRPTGEGSYRYRHVPIPTGYALLVVDSGVRHSNTRPQYNRRVAEGRIGVRLLQQRYPGITRLRDVQEEPWEALEPLLPEVIHTPELLALGIDPENILDGGVSPQTDTYYVRRRCRHVITENRRVLETVAALEAGQIARVGSLLRAAHASARDDYEISTPEIETLVRLAEAVPGVLGARLTGAGWGGCIVVLIAAESVSAFGESVCDAYRQGTGFEAHVFVCHSAAGAGAAFSTTIS